MWPAAGLQCRVKKILYLSEDGTTLSFICLLVCGILSIR